MEKIKFEGGEAEIATKEEAFWIGKKEVSERIIAQLKADLLEIPKLIEFHEAVVGMCADKSESGREKNGTSNTETD